MQGGEGDLPLVFPERRARVTRCSRREQPRSARRRPRPAPGRPDHRGPAPWRTPTPSRRSTAPTTNRCRSPPPTPPPAISLGSQPPPLARPAARTIAETARWVWSCGSPARLNQCPNTATLRPLHILLGDPVPTQTGAYHVGPRKKPERHASPVMDGLNDVANPLPSSDPTNRKHHPQRATRITPNGTAKGFRSQLVPRCAARFGLAWRQLTWCWEGRGRGPERRLVRVCRGSGLA